MPSDKEKRSGRVAFDARGQAIWEWEIAPGVFSADPGTDHLEVLDASASPLSLEEPGYKGVLPTGGKVVSGDPRNRVADPHLEPKSPRKSLDDLRRLSEEIKRARQWPTRKK